MRVDRPNENQFYITFDAKEMVDIRDLAAQEKSTVSMIVKKALESGVKLYRYIILGKG